ncbi:hypothetical protein ABK046_07125 [Streptomyces caeruleatus]
MVRVPRRKRLTRGARRPPWGAGPAGVDTSPSGAKARTPPASEPSAQDSRISQPAATGNRLFAANDLGRRTLSPPAERARSGGADRRSGPSAHHFPGA